MLLLYFWVWVLFVCLFLVFFYSAWFYHENKANVLSMSVVRLSTSVRILGPMLVVKERTVGLCNMVNSINSMSLHHNTVHR